MPVERSVLVRLKADPDPFIRGMAEAGAAVEGLRKEINTTNDRTAWLTQGILALAPAVVPLGAAAVPVFTGMATQLTVGAAAAGVFVLGIHGIGNALKALNAYQLNPTAANLTKLQNTMNGLSSQGREFVDFLSNLEPLFTKLQGTAQAGMLPGIQDGLGHLLTLAPQVNRIIGQIARGIGQLADEAGKGLAGPDFAKFFDFLERDAEPILIEMGHTVGHIAAGLAALFVDFLPESERFSTGLEHIAANFDTWAQGLDQTKGFQDFLDYINKSGPEALNFLDALFQALVEIVHAAAPIGNIELPVFTELLKVFAAIASTPLGTTLIGLGAAMSVYGRAVAVGSNLTTGMSRGLGIATGEALRTAFGFRALATDVGTYVTVARAGVTATDEMNANQATALTGIKAWGGAAARVGVQAGIIGFAATGLASKMHLANTASLALAGSLVGPWGAAVGAGVGLILDFAHHQSDAVASIEQVEQTLNQQTGAITNNTRQWAFNQLQQNGAIAAATSLGVSLSTLRQAALGHAGALASINGQVAALQGQTKGFYSASGAAPVVNPEDTKNIGILQSGLGETNSQLTQSKAAWQQHAAFMANDTTKTAANAKAQRNEAAALKAAQEAAATTAGQFLTLGKDVSNAKASLDKWIRELAGQARALENFGSNAEKAADKGLRDGLIKQLQALGPQGALRMQQLANATQSQIGKANHAWASGQRAAQDYQDAVAYIAQHPAAIYVNGIPQSIHAIRLVEEEMRKVQSKTVTITTRHATGGRSMHTGGFTGWGGRYEPAGVVHRGEVVVPQELVMRDWAWLKDRYGHLPGFSEGGLVGMSHGAAARSTTSISLDSGPMQVSGTLDTPWGPSQVRGVAVQAARDVYHAESSADREYAGKRARQ